MKLIRHRLGSARSRSPRARRDRRRPRAGADQARHRWCSAPPSLSAFLPPMIKAQKFDAANGLDLVVPERTPDAYATQFNSGEFKLGGSAARLS